MDYLSGLNERQREAVLHQDGPLLIVAGAGAGKTKTITYRIFHLLNNGVKPENILAVTFTNKAAKEMRERVVSLLGNSENSSHKTPLLSTFHSLGVYLLRRHGQLTGLSKNFTILDKDDAASVAKAAIKRMGLDDKKFPPKKIIGYISKQKGNLVTHQEFAESAKDYYSKIIASVWTEYEKQLKESDSVDFDDLLLKTAHLLSKHEDVRKYYQSLWKYIHIDEYQDTNTVQYQISSLLVGPEKNICVVGDMDQSIYGWRGADFTNIFNFEKDYPEAKVVLLEQNYRSTKNILEAANAVIKKNKKRKEKRLFTENDDGEKISLHSSLDENGEASYVAQKSRELIENGIDPSEIAVLYRANFQSRVLEEAFLREGVPYQVLGVRFFERKEIKDVLAYIKASINPKDGESLKRIINVPARGIGKVTLDKILAGQEEGLPASMRLKLNGFRRILESISEKAKTVPVSELIKFVMKNTGIEEELKKEGEEGEERIENLKELVTLATKYDLLPPEEGILELLTEGSLVSDQDTLDEKKNGVRLMTVHSSKGLEFDNVFITGLEQDLFPHTPLNTDEARDDEEERRLFYVAITRARKKLFLCYAQTRGIYGSRMMTAPSEFLFDIEEDLLEQEEVTTTNWIEI